MRSMHEHKWSALCVMGLMLCAFTHSPCAFAETVQDSAQALLFGGYKSAPISAPMLLARGPELLKRPAPSATRSASSSVDTPKSARAVPSADAPVSKRAHSSSTDKDLPPTVVSFITGDEFTRPDTTGDQGQYEGVTDYRIGANDLLEIAVFGVTDLSSKVRVNSRGMISLPLIGPVRAGGRTVPELEAEITKKLAADWVNDPQVSVFVQEFTSQRVTVEGSVLKPGVFPITGRTTLLQAIAVAQGFGPIADEHSVVIFRYINGQKKAALFDIPLIRQGQAEDPVIYGDDIVVVDNAGGKAFLKKFTDAIRGFVGFSPIPII